MYHTPRIDGYRPQSADTDPATDRYLIERLREIPPWRKAEMLSAATRAACDLALAGVRRRHPTAGTDEVRKRFAALVLGRDGAVALFGWDPQKEAW